MRPPEDDTEPAAPDEDGFDPSVREARELGLALQAQRERALIPEPEPAGECRWCCEEVEHPKLFCNSGCAKLYDRAKKRLGRDPYAASDD